MIQPSVTSSISVERQRQGSDRARRQAGTAQGLEGSSRQNRLVPLRTSTRATTASAGHPQACPIDPRQIGIQYPIAHLQSSGTTGFRLSASYPHPSGSSNHRPQDPGVHSRRYGPDGAGNQRSVSFDPGRTSSTPDPQPLRLLRPSGPYHRRLSGPPLSLP